MLINTHQPGLVLGAAIHHDDGTVSWPTSHCVPGEHLDGLHRALDLRSADLEDSQGRVPADAGWLPDYLDPGSRQYVGEQRAKQLLPEFKRSRMQLIHSKRTVATVRRNKEAA